MEKYIKTMLLISAFSIIFGIFYPKIPFLKDTIHAGLDPTFGALLDYNVTLGMIIIVGILSLITTLVQKYTTNQDELRKLRAEQKILSEQMKEFKDHPTKMLELQKKSLEFIPRTMDLTIGSAVYTFVPFILLIRWFSEYFVGDYPRILGFMTWFWAYLLFTIIFASVYRKLLKMA